MTLWRRPLRPASQMLLFLLSTTLTIRFSEEQTILGEYPGINSLATFRPVESTSICGENGTESYCDYTSNAVASLLPNCARLQCDSSCPFTSASPEPLDLATLFGSFGSGVSATQGRPGSSTSALRFQDSSISISAANVPLISANGFSFAAWFNQDEGNEG